MLSHFPLPLWPHHLRGCVLWAQLPDHDEHPKDRRAGVGSFPHSPDPDLPQETGLLSHPTCTDCSPLPCVRALCGLGRSAGGLGGKRVALPRWEPETTSQELQGVGLVPGDLVLLPKELCSELGSREDPQSVPPLAASSRTDLLEPKLQHLGFTG